MGVGEVLKGGAGKKSISVDMLKEWIDESFRAIAPKRLVKMMDGNQARSNSAITRH
ncbi:MAG TPA: hypothetical protein VHL58_17895 [Thermoanaerobaculia bacterium]|nr:hypothetical protein [Thermoanaerobaculia bacterium]